MAPASGADLEPYGSPAHSEWLDVDWEAHRHSIAVEGARVNYVRMGEGPPVLFLHGLSGSWQNWLENIPHFARSRTAIAVDLPGFGRSEVPRGEVSIPRYARFVDSFLGELGLGETALVGSSMGGLIAAEAAATRPQRVPSLVLVSAAGAGRRAAPAEEVRASGVLGSLARAAGPHARWLLRFGAVRRAALGRLMTHPERISRRIVHEIAAGVARPGSTVARRATAHNDVGTRVRDIGCPTLLLWGADDRVIPLYVASYYEETIPGARKVVLPDTGHVPMIERPALFNRLVSEFLAAT